MEMKGGETDKQMERSEGTEKERTLERMARRGETEKMESGK